MAQAKQAGTIMIEGQQQGDPHHDKMGVYTLVEGKCVNGRGVWTKKEEDMEQQRYLYYTKSNKWGVGDRISMEVGEARGWMKVASTALTPDKITETWEVDISRLRPPFHSHLWHDAPKVKTRELPALVVSGFPSSEAKSSWFSPKSESKLNGRYLPMEGKLVNGHSVWHDEGGSNFLYFAQRKTAPPGSQFDHWWISDHEDMEVGAPRGFAKVKVRFGGMPYNKHEECECWQIFEQGKWEDAQDATVQA
jgi:hypothetical protein